MYMIVFVAFFLVILKKVLIGTLTQLPNENPSYIHTHTHTNTFSE